MFDIRRVLFYGLVIVLCASLIEAVVLSRRHGYDWRSAGISVFNLAARLLFSYVLPLSIATPIINLAWAHRIAAVPLDRWQALLVLFIGQEFCYYCFHRVSHRVRWFWAHHSVHHSPNDLTLATALRAGIFGKLIGIPLFFAPLVWLGFPPQVVLGALALNLLYQFWIHATWIPSLGWLEYLLNTPSAHRVHHASNIEYLDVNYGGVLIIFDRMFGTYVKERQDLPCRYGLVHPITSYNPLRVEFAGWVSLLNDVLRASSAKAALGYVFRPPGWQPDNCTANDG